MNKRLHASLKGEYGASCFRLLECVSLCRREGRESIPSCYGHAVLLACACHGNGLGIPFKRIEHAVFSVAPPYEYCVMRLFGRFLLRVGMFPHQSLRESCCLHDAVADELKNRHSCIISKGIVQLCVMERSVKTTCVPRCLCRSHK